MHLIIKQLLKKSKEFMKFNASLTLIFPCNTLLLKRLKKRDSKFNLEEWVKRRYSDPLKKTILRN